VTEQAPRTAANPTAKADPTTLSGQAAAEILRRIESLELAPGAVFTERDLAAELGMSKAPVREALLQLSGYGLLTPRTGSGYTITPITLRGARDLFEAWALVEEASVATLLHRAPPWDWATELRGMLARVSDGPHAHDQVDQERAFHLFFLLVSRNEYFMRLFPGFDVARVLRLAARLGHEVGCPDGTHDALIDAVERGDPDAPAMARRNVDALGQRVVDAMINAQKLQDINLGEP